MVLARIGWTPHTAILFTTHTGLKLNLKYIAPAAVARYAANATLNWSDIKATEGKLGDPGIAVFWEALQGLLKGPLSKNDAGTLAWTQSHRNALVYIMAGGEWPQYRQFLHGKSTTALCRLCGHAQCTLWHRRYECDAWQQDRQSRTPTYLLQAASRISSPTLRERFAKGLLPAPTAMIPLPRTNAQLTTQWVNKPPSGFLTGTLFLDGSGTGGQIPFLRRAGWAVVQVDPEGKLVAAAYGAVPWEAAPAQVARDGEDYAVYMLTSVAQQPFSIYVDCAGTVGAATDPLVGTKPRHLRAHLWDEIWKSFKDLQVHKTKAHATETDVLQGITTRWEMQGNALADEYAKAGVEAHGITTQHCLEVRALAKIAYHAAKWAAVQYATMSKEQHTDSDMLQPKQRLRPAKRRLQLPKRNTSRAPIGVASTQHGVGNHHVRAATASDCTTVLFCIACGSYKWKRTGKLGTSCPKHPRGPGAKQRLNMLHALRFPSSTSHMRIGTHRNPTLEELSTIRATPQSQPTATGSSWREQWNCLARLSVAAPTRSEILTAYGQTEEFLKEHTANLALADAKRNLIKNEDSAKQQAKKQTSTPGAA